MSEAFAQAVLLWRPRLGASAPARADLCQTPSTAGTVFERICLHEPGDYTPGRGPYNRRMPMLIDGHNVIGQMREISLSDPDDEERFVAKIQRYAARVNKRITVIFDPGRHALPSRWVETRQAGAVKVIFAPPGQKADDLIRDRVASERDKQGLQVVTSDAAVANFARQCGIRNITSAGEFIKAMDSALRPGPGGEKPSPHLEYENWADVFREPPQPAKPANSAPPPPPPPKTSKAERLRQQLSRARPLPGASPESRPFESDGELKTDRRRKG